MGCRLRVFRRVGERLLLASFSSFVIDGSRLEEMADKRSVGDTVKIGKNDIFNIYKLCQ